MREINADEVYKLSECLRALSEYHNEVSVHFKGVFPVRPYETTLKLFEDALNRREAFIAVAEEKDEIVGFCKVDISGENGKLDYLVLREAFRGRGFGRELMDWAMDKFAGCGVRHVEVKVIDGNPALRLYEKYGFRVKSHILGLER